MTATSPLTNPPTPTSAFAALSHLVAVVNGNSGGATKDKSAASATTTADGIAVSSSEEEDDGGQLEQRQQQHFTAAAPTTTYSPPLFLQTRQQRIDNASEAARIFVGIAFALLLLSYFRQRYDTVNREHALIIQKNADARKREQERKRAQLKQLETGVNKAM